MTDLFQNVLSAHEPLDGWCSQAKAITLASIVVTLRPAVIVEVGVYGGKSLIPMAMALKAVNPTGVCFGIDSWSKEVAMREQTTDQDREWWGKLDLDMIFHKFVTALSKLGLTNICKIYRCESQQFNPVDGVGIFHCDGSHSQTAFNDIVRFAPKVIVGGYCVTDDSEWTGGGVSRGERWLIDNGFKHLYKLETGAVFQKIR